MSTKKQWSGVRGQGSETNSKLKIQNSKLIFITGGARSGKSAFALNLANQMVGAGLKPAPTKNKKCYLATAQALDFEMEERIARHKAERGPDWDSIEEPLRVADIMHEGKGRYDVILLDCLTLWVSNLMHNYNIPSPLEGEGQGLEEVLAPGGCEGRLKKEFEALISAFKTSGTTVIVVSNEVGLGIVPENKLAREFRDIAGTANQLFAKAADEAYFVVSGIPMRLK